MILFATQQLRNMKSEASNSLTWLEAMRAAVMLLKPMKDSLGRIEQVQQMWVTLKKNCCGHQANNTSHSVKLTRCDLNRALALLQYDMV